MVARFPRKFVGPFFEAAIFPSLDRGLSWVYRAVPWRIVELDFSGSGGAFMQSLKGIFPVPVTPFKGSGQSVDYETLERHVDRLLESGIHGLAANGSTSETGMLSDDEYDRVAATVIKRVAGRVPVIVGVTSPSTRGTLDLCKRAADLGASAYLMLPPYFYPLSEREILDHYETVARETSLPIVLYNNPSTSRADLKPELVAELAKIENIKYIKEATGDIARIYAIKALAGENIEVFAGSDTVFFDSLVAGAIGAISASGNVLASQMVAIYELFAEKKDMDEARARFVRIFPLFRFIDGSRPFVGRGEWSAPIKLF
jgi:4-hydroxy-tetrahydrodipicolinate synthase